MIRIAEVGVYRVDLPLTAPFIHASAGRVEALEEIVVRVRCTDGVTGWGEARGNAAYATGSTMTEVLDAAIRLSRSLLGHPVDRFAEAAARMDAGMAGHAPAKMALDIAIHDAAARARGVPVADLLGGARRRQLPTDISLPFAEPEQIAAQARDAVDEGFRTVKVRVGDRADADNARLAAARRAIDGKPDGAAVTFAADANGAWNRDEAIRRLRRWAPYRLAWIEQPVPASDLEDLAAVTRESPVPVMADESVMGPAGLRRLLNAGAADLLHFKLAKAGGITRLLEMAAMADAAGKLYMIGQMDEGMLATAAAVHCGAACAARHFEVHGYVRVRRQPFRGLTYDRGTMMVPSGPGLGVDVDDDALTLVHVAQD